VRRLEHNTAGDLGGAIYYDSCSKLEKMCFVQGIEPLSGSRAILLRHNRARAGGAVYVECSDMGICAEAFGENNKIGVLPELPRAEFTGSQASSYGNTLATQPASMRWHVEGPGGLEIVPSRTSQCTPRSDRSASSDSQQLTVAVQPLDSLGTVARGLEDVAEVRVCRTLGACTKDSAVLPVVFEPFDPQTGVSTSSLQLECPLGANEVALVVSLVRFIEVPELRASILCGKCRAGESKTEDRNSNTWFCMTCESKEYVMDPNNAAHGCQSCPVGGTCNDGAFTPLPGSEWERDEAAGVYRVASCAAGSFIVTAPYLQQACLPCEAGFYCPGGKAPALKCPPKTFSTPEASSKEACVEADFVGVTVTLPLSESEFDSAKQAGFKQAIASSAGVNASYVEIISFAQTSARRRESRALLAAALDVETKIASTEGDVKDLVKKLDQDTINQNLQQHGLPPGEVTKAPTVITEGTNSWSTLSIILIAVAGLVVLLLVGLVVVKCTAKKKVEKPYEQRKEEARRRMEIRRSEFPTRLSKHEERMRRTEARQARVTGSKALKAATAESIQLSATLHIPMPPGNLLNLPQPSTASLHTVTNPPDGIGMTHVLPPLVQDSSMHASGPAVGTKFEAKQLILGKSEDSVLDKYIGLDEKALSLALANPMAALEKEWFPGGFRSLLQESKAGDSDYGDDQYRLGMTQAEQKFRAGVIDPEEFFNEKQRLEDEYEDRKYKWWNAGANFDYLAYGEVGDRSNAEEDFWLPPLVRHRELTGWPGEFIQPGDYDSGQWDLPYLQLQLNVAKIGEVDNKGRDNEERKVFKSTISIDLSRSSAVPIAADNLVVIQVLSDASTEQYNGGVRVVVMVLENSAEQEGADACWELARALCEQSSVKGSTLFQGEVTRHLAVGGITLIRERERTGMSLEDFFKQPICQLAGLSLWHVFVLRAYTTDAYPLFNDPMRSRIKPHPLMYTMYFLDQSLKLMTTGARFVSSLSLLPLRMKQKAYCIVTSYRY